ncbi:MAG: terpene cyclase/mutase family protein [Lachnospiraceae bacterium]|nr:terpene cyclase/mutase family protein [Lachnospiraceae bacterium]
MYKSLYKKLLSVLLVLIMMFSQTPISAFASEQGTDSGKVYISISYDGQYNDDIKGNDIAYVEVSMDDLAEINLADYELGDYVYDADGDGINEITALHLYIYTHEEICGGNWSDVGVSGGAGSIFFERGLFGFEDCNLNYYLNGEYPAVDGWGTTADRIVLSSGDFLDIAGYTSWNFWSDSAAGFHYFADNSGNITHSYTGETGNDTTIKLVSTYSDMYSGSGNDVREETYYTVYYGKTFGVVDGKVSTDDTGCANISFNEAGTWYLWCEGGYGAEYPDEIVSSPAYAKVVVTETVDPDEEAAEAVISKIQSIGTVTLESETAIIEAREAYDALTDAQKELVTNYSTLTTAEATLAQLKETEEEPEEKPALIDTNPKEIYEATYEYLSDLGTPSVGSVGGEWMVIDLTRGGYACPNGYYDNVVSYINENINANEQLHRAKSTDNSRVILALTSAGYDVTDVDGHNLLMGLTDMTYVKKQGINGPIWALMAFDSHDYEIPTNSAATEQVTREKLIKCILDNQLEDGGWKIGGTSSDVDMTAMAIQSLAPYYNTNAEVKAAVDEAVVLLSNRQNEYGGFGSVDGACSESCAQVIVALTALGINPETDERFVKNGYSVVDALCGFAVEGGGFAHIPSGSINGMATEQSQYALAAYFRFLDGKTSLYDMVDVIINKVSKDDSGKIENVTDESKNECAATLDVTDAGLKDKLLTADEKKLLEEGADIKIDLNVDDISDTVSQRDKTLIEEKLGSSKVGLYLDITLSKQIGDNSPVAITETNGEVTVSITVPKNLVNTDSSITRTYNILRIHEGKVDVLATNFDSKTGKLSFNTDAFSTYVLVYEDKEVNNTVDNSGNIIDNNVNNTANDNVSNSDSNVEVNTPATGDNSNIWLYTMLMMLSLIGMVAILKNNEKARKTN